MDTSAIQANEANRKPVICGRFCIDLADANISGVMATSQPATRGVRKPQIPTMVPTSHQLAMKGFARFLLGNPKVSTHKSACSLFSMKLQYSDILI